MRTSAALLAGTAGIAALGAGLMPATATAATASPQSIAAQIVPAGQLASFKQIISHESGWNVHATNPSSGAYGLAQALPGSKMASAGADWKTNPKTQIKWAYDYMNSRYGSPNAAWSFWQTHHWY
ncbi:transglycosylase SLT domain-containing protein [Kitasatospora sp. NBC_01539]|uniref:aggregation-promoting factor C-terminal-like domain-containing protein n=1 Tax=Kitasatospora sp. NBC_01539 TaxID=2903577 RepID=UPI0038600AC3